MKNNVGFYADIGWGIQFANHHTDDLDSATNSTPYAGIGLAFRMDHTEALLGVRLLHISNGGTKGANSGQNELLFMLSFRF